MRATISSQVEVAAPARDVFGYVTDWPRQAEWVPLTRVQAVDAADRVGGRIRAWTGLGPLGFWDPMTITCWRTFPDGSATCEVLHTGRVVRGDAGFAVERVDDDRCRLTWWERVELPLPRPVWARLAPVADRLLGLVTARLARRADLIRGR